LGLVPGHGTGWAVGLLSGPRLGNEGQLALEDEAVEFEAAPGPRLIGHDGETLVIVFADVDTLEDVVIVVDGPWEAGSEIGYLLPRTSIIHDAIGIETVIEGAVRAHLDHRRLVAVGAALAPKHRYSDREALGRMLGRIKLAQADTLESPAVGEGVDVRFETDRITGSALLRHDQVVHAEVHRVA
jgi:hypothetical protein